MTDETNPSVDGKVDTWQAACGVARSERDALRAEVQGLRSTRARAEIVERALQETMAMTTLEELDDALWPIDDYVTPGLKAAYDMKRASIETAQYRDVELGRAYRCILGMHNALHKVAEFAEAYHSPTVAAAKRYVWEGSLEGTGYFIGKPVAVLHAALALPESGEKK